MLTLGTGDGEVTGRVDADLVYHASLSLDAYRSHLAANDCDIVACVAGDPTCNQQSVLSAAKAQ